MQVFFQNIHILCILFTFYAYLMNIIIIFAYKTLAYLF